MAQKIAIVKNIQGVTFTGRSDSNHWVMMDGPEDFGGSNAGSRPKELFLMSLGGCTGSDVASILRKRRAPLTAFEIRLTGNESNDHPKVFTDIHIEYIFYGDGLDSADIEKAIELSTTKYCSVSAMIKASIKITHSFRIESAASAMK